MRMMTLGLASLLVCGLTLAHGDDKKNDNKAKIVGVWEVVKGTAPKGSTTEFTKDGKIKVVMEFVGRKIMLDGTYELDGDSMKTVLKKADPDLKDRKETLKIKKLTETDLVTEDENGKTDEYMRKPAKEK